jgi:hypothetical protein
VKAISEKAKISGLLVQKVELGPAGAFEEAKTIEDFADILLDGPAVPWSNLDR